MINANAGKNYELIVAIVISIVPMWIRSSCADEIITKLSLELASEQAKHLNSWASVPLHLQSCAFNSSDSDE